MLAAGVVASFGVAGVSAKQGNDFDFESLLANPAMGDILAKMPAGEGMMGLEKMMQEVQNMTPAEQQEMQANVMEQMQEMQDKMMEKMPEIKAQLMAQVDELKNADSKSELVQKQFDAELDALKAQLELAQRVEEQDEFGNLKAVDEALIAELKASINKKQLLAPMEKQKIAQSDNDAGNMMGAMVGMTDVLVDTIEEAKKLPENPTEEDKQAVKATLMEKMNPMLENMGAVFRQTLDHLPEQQKDELLAQLTGPNAGPMAGMLEKLIEGEPLTMEDMEQEAREIMYKQQEYELKMQKELEEAEARLEEAEVAEEAAELLAIKEHLQ